MQAGDKSASPCHISGPSVRLVRLRCKNRVSSAFDAAREFPVLAFARRDEAGVREAAECVFAALSMPVFHYLLGLVGDRAEAEDLTQEVFLRLFAELRAGKRIDRVRPWCFKVAHNLAASAGRRRQSAAEHRPEVAGLAPQTDGVEAELLHQEQTERVAAAMARLTPMERQSLHMRTEGLLYREIADVLNVRVPTVQTLLSRAMKKIVKEIHG